MTNTSHQSHQNVVFQSMWSDIDFEVLLASLEEPGD